MIKCHCDICGVETFINPPTKPITREETQEYFVFDETTKKRVAQKRTIQVPEMTFMRMQDPTDCSKMIDQPIPKLEDLKPRMWRVQLRVGQECIDRDFCKECLDKHFRSELASLRGKLEEVKRK